MIFTVMKYIQILGIKISPTKFAMNKVIRLSWFSPSGTFILLHNESTTIYNRMLYQHSVHFETHLLISAL